MSTLAWIGLGLLVLGTIGLVVGAGTLERKAAALEWLHPPEDDDGVRILKDDDPDGNCTR